MKGVIYVSCLNRLIAWVVLSLGTFSMILGNVNTVLASDPIKVGYRDFSYPPGTGSNSEVTAEKPESKLWWNDGFWWASMWSTAGNSYRIFRLDLTTQDWVDTGTNLDPRQTTKADALWDGQKLYVVSHVWTSNGQPTSAGNRGELFRYSYNSATKTYSLDAGFPVEVNQARSETLVITKDTTGQLWVTWVENSQVMVNRSLNGNDLTWGTPFVLPVGSTANVTSDDISSVITYEGVNESKRVGLMWSNQNSPKTMHFATHQDGQPDTSWQSGPAYTLSADDHVNLKSLESDDAGSIFAVVKTSSSSALIVTLVLDRGANGTATHEWSNYPVYTSNTYNPTRPQLIIDTSNRDLYVFTRNIDPNGDRGIFYKKSDMDNIQFPSGLGTPFIVTEGNNGINDPTTTKQNANSTTGIVILASDSGPDEYYHNYLPLGGAPVPDITVNPAAHNYGDVIVGSSATQTFTVGNDGTQNLIVNSTTLTGGTAGEFNIDSGGGAFTLPPESTHDIVVSFNPTSTGAKSTTLRISSNDPDENPFDVALTGNALPLPQPEITLTPINPPIQIPAGGGSFSYDIQVTNNGSSSVTFDLWNLITVPNGNQVGPTVGPVTVTFNPGQSVTKTLTQQIPAGAPGGSYTFSFNAGTFPGTVSSSDSFPFSKTGGSSAGKLTSVNDQEGWLTLDAEKGLPINPNNWDEVLRLASTDAVPEAFVLEQNYPNPFNPSTVIRYGLNQDSKVKLTVYNILGQEIVTLVDEFQNAGHKSVVWNGKDNLGNLVSAGIYFYKIEAGDFVKINKMVFAK